MQSAQSEAQLDRAKALQIQEATHKTQSKADETRLWDECVNLFIEREAMQQKSGNDKMGGK